MTRPPKVLMIVPAFNEGRMIGRLIRDIRKKTPPYDLVVIDDCSTDDTRKQAMNAGAAVVTLPFNLGIGGAVQTGLKIAYKENYDIAIQIDGDGQHHPGSIEDILKPVLTGKLDLCIGSRFLDKHSRFRSTRLRRIGIGFFSALLSMMTGKRLTDPTSGFRAIGRVLIKRFSEYYPVDFPEPEAVQMANRLGAKIGEVPVKMRKRLGGISSIRFGATLYYMIKVTFGILIDSLKQKSRRDHGSQDLRDHHRVSHSRRRH